MVATSRVGEIIADTRGMHAEALERLAAGDIQDAAERLGVPQSGRPTP